MNRPICRKNDKIRYTRMEKVAFGLMVVLWILALINAWDAPN